VPTVAIACDHLVQRGGAERVVLAMLRAFPGAPVYTSVHRPAATYPEFRDADVRTTALDRVPPLRRWHRLAFPLMAPAFSALRIPADVVLVSSAGWAHGVRTGGATVCYCHSPARWLYQPVDRYTGGASAQAAVVGAIRGPLLRWDRRAAERMDVILTNSTTCQRRIREAYDRDAVLLPPPVTIDPGGTQEPVPGVAPGYLLAVGRMLPYKNVHQVVAAFAALPHLRLVVVGRGPLLRRIEAVRTANVTVLPGAPDAQLRWLYANAAGHVTASYEDFGMTPVEAAAFGRPTAALRFGGFLDTIVEGETGVLFDEPEPAAIAAAVDRLTGTAWDPARLRAHAARYDLDAFVGRLRDVVAAAAAGRA
jgi:glycosyltransferase involved in cell wall biosynthesis